VGTFPWAFVLAGVCFRPVFLSGASSFRAGWISFRPRGPRVAMPGAAIGLRVRLDRCGRRLCRALSRLAAGVSES
jgi:hypothetical protein